MKALKILVALILMLSLTIPALAGKGPGGPGGPGGGGGGGGGGTQPDIPDTGELYGDLYVILRDENGVPIFDANGCIQPISAVDGGTLEIYDSTDTTVLFTTTAIAGEPFSLAFYTDATIELDVECELTEEMATWVETVDFGRLNLGRAPDSVIAHAFDEAIKKMNDATEISLDPAGRLVLTLPDEETGDLVDKTIDAPAENLALYIAMMTEGDWYTEDTTPIVHGGLPTDMGPPEGDGPSAEPRPVLNETAIGLLEALGLTNLGDAYNPEDPEETGAGDLNNDELLLAASLLAAAADKTGSITLDKVVYINFIYGINQLGTLTDGTVDGRAYFDFGDFSYDRGLTYTSRGSMECDFDENGTPEGWVWVLQPDLEWVTQEDGASSLVEVPNHFETKCMEILGYDATTNPNYNAVRFTDLEEKYYQAYDEGVFMSNTTELVENEQGELEEVDVYVFDFSNNVRAFTKAADDALQVIEYIHNYKVPEVLYP